MRAAGREVCGGFEIGVDEDQKLIGGARYRDKRPVAVSMWNTVMETLQEIGALPRTSGREDARKKSFPERFRSKPENAAKAAAETAAPTRKEWRRVSTTVPREWEVRLWEATRTSTYRLAHELLYRWWRAGTGQVQPRRRADRRLKRAGVVGQALTAFRAKRALRIGAAWADRSGSAPRAGRPA